LPFSLPLEASKALLYEELADRALSVMVPFSKPAFFAAAQGGGSDGWGFCVVLVSDVVGIGGIPVNGGLVSGSGIGGVCIFSVVAGKGGITDMTGSVVGVTTKHFLTLFFTIFVLVVVEHRRQLFLQLTFM